MNYRAPFRLSTLGALVLSLSACGGGGGGGGTVPTTSSYTPTATTTGTSTTTSTAPTAPIVYCCDSTAVPTTISETLQLDGGVSNGFAVTVNLRAPQGGGGSAAITGGTGASPASVTVNGSGAISSLTHAAVNATAWSNSFVYPTVPPVSGTSWLDVLNSSVWPYFVDWTDPNHIQVAGAALSTGAAGPNSGSSQKYQYLAWGWWATSDYASTDTMIDSVEGYMVVGKPTAPENIPTTGSATYVGETRGTSLDGVIYSTFNATADFVNREVAVSSVSTVVEIANVGLTAAPQYDFSGTLTYAAGVNQFSGTIATQNAAMTGTATGMFYGPTAEEIGGVFELTNGGTAKGLFVAN